MFMTSSWAESYLFSVWTFFMRSTWQFLLFLLISMCLDTCLVLMFFVVDLVFSPFSIAKVRTFCIPMLDLAGTYCCVVRSGCYLSPVIDTSAPDKVLSVSGKN